MCDLQVDHAAFGTGDGRLDLGEGKGDRAVVEKKTEPEGLGEGGRHPRNPIQVGLVKQTHQTLLLRNGKQRGRPGRHSTTRLTPKGGVSARRGSRKGMNPGIARA